MATRQQIEHLAQRIERLVEQASPKAPAPVERWLLDHGMARCLVTGEEIREAELEGRKCAGVRIVWTVVDPPARHESGRVQVAGRA
jgi:hypothetical protein